MKSEAAARALDLTARKSLLALQGVGRESEAGALWDNAVFGGRLRRVLAELIGEDTIFRRKRRVITAESA
jgi:hypothetical protein